MEERRKTERNGSKKGVESEINVEAVNGMSGTMLSSNLDVNLCLPSTAKSMRRKVLKDTICEYIEAVVFSKSELSTREILKS